MAQFRVKGILNLQLSCLGRFLEHHMDWLSVPLGLGQVSGIALLQQGSDALFW
ncbi:MAG: hypothetical protein AB8A67_03315 [Prochlorococcus sp.]|nr:hypothetical protein [Prochlorococcaceae cyanobacterium ETNP2_MAG_10]MDP6321676.1 hypothetical protein [Prochlorococcaceae cyanobacterium ETNP14_MAG_5]MDP6851310.1 hypothetical protein [Prochlorococcaceae cyanobacterium ETNP1_MAG_8]